MTQDAKHAVTIEVEIDLLKRQLGQVEGMLSKVTQREYPVNLGISDAHVQKYKQSIGQITQLQEAAASAPKRSSAKQAT